MALSPGVSKMCPLRAAVSESHATRKDGALSSPYRGVPLSGRKVQSHLLCTQWPKARNLHMLVNAQSKALSLTGSPPTTRSGFAPGIDGFNGQTPSNQNGILHLWLYAVTPSERFFARVRGALKTTSFGGSCVFSVAASASARAIKGAWIARNGCLLL
jgi:hypothetical protein